MLAELRSEVWLPIVTLVAGYGFSLLTEAQRDKRTSERERRARAEEREAITDDRRIEIAQKRAAFQRETLLELQEVMYAEGRQNGRLHHADLMANAESSTWRRVELPDDIGGDASLAIGARLNILRVRVADDSLRADIEAFKEAGSQLALAGSRMESEDALDQSLKAFIRANERIGELLREE